MDSPPSIQAILVDWDALCAGDKMDVAISKLCSVTDCERVAVIGVRHSLSRIRQSPQTALIAQRAPSYFCVRSARDDFGPREDNPLVWIEECVVRFIEESDGSHRSSWRSRRSNRNRTFDVLCISASPLWREALASICVRSGYFVRCRVLSIFNTSDPRCVAVSVRSILNLSRRPSLLRLDHAPIPFIAEMLGRPSRRPPS